MTYATYAIGDQVDDYVLTERGWVPRLELSTSPFRPGHVVGDSILTGALEWQPLRTAPEPAYRVGDVVEGYVLVPSGDWLPLTDQVRDRSGAAQAAAALAEPTANAQSSAKKAQSSAKKTQSSATTQRSAMKTQRSADTRVTQSQQPRVQTSSAQPQRASRPAPVQYRVGQVVDGHVLTADRGWVPLPEVRRPAPQPASGKPATKNDAIGRALFGAIAVIVLILLRSCG